MSMLISRSVIRHVVRFQRPYISRTLATSKKDELIVSSTSSVAIVSPPKEEPPSHEQVFEKLSEENVAEAAMMMFQRLIAPSGETGDKISPRREHLLRMNTESLVLKTHKKPSLERYNVLISAQAERGDLDACLRSFERMREIHEILPNELTFMSILKACEISGDSDRALAVIESLENAQIEPSETMYTMLGKMYAKSGDTESLYKLHNRLCREIEERAADEFDPSISSPLWNVSLTTTVLSSLIREGTGVSLRRAWEMFDEFRMGHGKPDKYMLSCMASACGITGDAEKAIALLEEFEIDSMGTPPAAAFAGVRPLSLSK